MASSRSVKLPKDMMVLVTLWLVVVAAMFVGKAEGIDMLCTHHCWQAGKVCPKDMDYMSCLPQCTRFCLGYDLMSFHGGKL